MGEAVQEAVRGVGGRRGGRSRPCGRRRRSPRRRSRPCPRAGTPPARPARARRRRRRRAGRRPGPRGSAAAARRTPASRAGSSLGCSPKATSRAASAASAGVTAAAAAGAATASGSLHVDVLGHGCDSLRVLMIGRADGRPCRGGGAARHVRLRRVGAHGRDGARSQAISLRPASRRLRAVRRHPRRVQQRHAHDQVGAAELRVVQLGAVVDGEQQPLLALPVGGADRRAGRVDGQQGDQVRQFGVAAAGLGEQPGQPARRVVRAGRAAPSRPPAAPR